jgi:hypothetical protein
MTEDQKEFWLGVVMHFVIAGLVAFNALPFIDDVPFWLTLLALGIGAAGGLFMASRAWTVHATHRPSLPRGLAEGIVIVMIVYAVISQFEGMPHVWKLAVSSVMVAVPAWFSAYATYMLVETLGSTRQPTRF